jgi:hypothetical protein
MESKYNRWLKMASLIKLGIEEKIVSSRWLNLQMRFSN